MERYCGHVQGECGKFIFHAVPSDVEFSPRKKGNGGECRNKHIVRCGRCHHITCYDQSGNFTCAYCGNSGKVSGTMKRIEVYESSGMKNGLKQDGMKYYPGDK